MLTIEQKLAQFGRAITPAELAELLHVSKKSIYKLIAKDLIPHFRVNTSVRLWPGNVAQWLARQ